MYNSYSYCMSSGKVIDCLFKMNFSAKSLRSVFCLAVIFAALIYLYIVLSSGRCYPAADMWPYRTSYPHLPTDSYLKNGIETNGLLSKSVNSNGTMTVLEREKFQQNQVDLFCEKYNLNHNQTPYNPSKGVYHRLLVNKDSETLFCFVPKAGCTSLMVLYFVAQGLLPKSVATTNPGGIIDHSILIDIQAKTSLNNYDKKHSTMALSTYYKFVMYRNPLERLVSGYRNKVEKFPLLGLQDNEPHFNWIRKCIYKYTYPQKFKKWASNGGRTPLNITFPDFVSYWLNAVDCSARYEPHFMPIFELCEPCSIRYDYYGNFATFQQDAEVLVNKINSSMDFLRQSYYSNPNKETNKLKEHFYKQLSLKQKKGVLKRLAVDLDFYYHLFPAERNIHERILNVTTIAVLYS